MLSFWIFFVKLRNNNCTTFKIFQDLIKVVPRHFHTVKYMRWVVVSIPIPGMPIP